MLSPELNRTFAIYEALRISFLYEGLRTFIMVVSPIKLFVVAISIMLTLALASYGQSRSGSSPAEEIKLLDKQWLVDSYWTGEMSAYDRIVAPGFKITHSNGDVLTKAEKRADIVANRIVDPAAPFRPGRSEQVFYGNVAVSRGVLIERASNVHFTHTYVRRGGRWQVIASQLTRRQHATLPGGANPKPDRAALWTDVPGTDVPPAVDPQKRYLFYLHGRIVEEGRRPTSPEYGVYEYDEILDRFLEAGFVVISEQRAKATDVALYGQKVAGQVRRLITAGVSPANITVVGASQGGWIAMLASTYLKNPNINYVFISVCRADPAFLSLVDLHGDVLFIKEQSEPASDCAQFRADATGIRRYQEIMLNTGLRHGFLFRPLYAWLDPTFTWTRN